jgi:hypothetical protein
MAPSRLLGIDGPQFLLGAATVFALVVFALPFIDRRGSKLTAWAAWLALAVFLLLGTSGLR